MDQILMTQNKYDELQNELAHRINELRPVITTQVAQAREHGDLKENGEYHAARDEQGKNESRIAEIQELLKRAVIVQKTHSDTIQLSSVVTVQKSTGEQVVYTLVSPHEADIRSAKLSIDSPVGRLLLGHKVGDIIIHTTPAGVVEYTVVAVA